MPKDLDLELLRRSIEVVSDSLGDEEAIVQIHKGRTKPGRQVFHLFKFDIATLDVNLSTGPTNRRSLIVTINQDSLGSAVVEPPQWEPWDYIYSK